MKIIERRRATIGDEELETAIYQDICAALNAVSTVDGKFIVNDTEWYWQNPAGEIKRTVVNSASFITSTFQNRLKKLGWEKEKTINGQNFDAYREFQIIKDLVFCDGCSFVELLEQYERVTETPSGPIATKYYVEFFERGALSLESVPNELHNFFSVKKTSRSVRCGLEFETGNIASSFRAITKLDSLFRDNAIDIGIFLTSIDKKQSSTRIWPSSNRNGSFEELDNRRFRSQIEIPLWEIGFAPDGFDRSSGYLSHKGELYKMQDMETSITVEGNVYQVFNDYKRQQKLLPATQQGFFP